MGEGCPSEDAIADFVARRATAESVARIEEHLDICSACRELVSALAMHTNDAVDATDAADATTPPGRASELPRERIGRFEVAERLGAGGMGVVYAAHDPTLDRRVALKFLHERDRTEAVARLLREAQALARLSHPNVVAVYEVGEHEGHVFIAMELVVGGTLTAWLRARKRPWTEILDAFVQAGRGLAAAHTAGFVHRDFKPDNVLFGDDGRARVTDFGLARLGDAPTKAPPPQALVDELTRTGALLGTPAYMAPEQLDGRMADARSDQFAFCVALHEALVGVRPFEGATVAALRAAIAQGPRPIARSSASRRVLAAVRRGLSEEPAARFPSMEELLAELARPPSRRRWMVASAAGLVAVAALSYRAVHSGGRAPEPCHGGAAELTSVWDPSVKTAAKSAFAATGAPYADATWRTAEQLLDADAAAWVAMRDATCADSYVRHTQSDELLDRRMSCLDSHLAELRSLTGALAHADREILERAVVAAGALPSVAACGDKAGLVAVEALPSDPARRADVEALDQKLAGAATLWNLGKLKEAQGEVDAAVVRARELDYRPVLARALYRRGLAQVGTERHAARASLRDAARTAELARLDGLRADALIALVGLAADDVARPGPELDGAEALAEDASAVVQRIGGDPVREGRLDANRASVLLSAGKSAEALVLVRAALALDEKALPPDSFQLADGLARMGSALHDLGQLEDGVAYQRRALHILEAILGPTHPNVARALHNLGLTLQEQGQLAEARATFEKSLAIYEGAYGSDRREVAQSLAALGSTLAYMGLPAEALPRLTRARDVYEKVVGHPSPDILDSLGRTELALGHSEQALANHTRALELRVAELGPEDRDVAISHLNIGQMFLVLHRFSDAVVHLREALRIDEKLFGEASATLLTDLELLGQSEVHAKRPRDAATHLERAVAIGESQPVGQPLILATARFYLARALWDAGGAHPRAHKLVADARAVAAPIADDPQATELLREIDEWSANHK
jgi:tetratricopeptide (TPR) repeat protein